MAYKYKDFVYFNDDAKGRLYKGNQLLYLGNAWTGIGEFLKHTENAPEVQEMFKNQIAQRENNVKRAKSRSD